MDTEFVKWLATLGVGGSLAAFMFIYNKKEMIEYVSKLTMLTEQWRITAETFAGIVKENTASNTKLIVILENQERNSIRKQDIELMITGLIDRKLGRE